MPNNESKNENSSRESDIKNRFDDLKNRERAFNSRVIINENKSDDMKEELMGKLFKKMEESGVDPSNVESINAFLQKLEVQDPDLRELYEFFFNEITSDKEVLEQGAVPAPIAPQPQAPAPPIPAQNPGFPNSARVEPTPL